jgi:hypothetical protein
MKHVAFVLGLAALGLVLGAGAIVMHARSSFRPGTVGSVLGGIPGILRPTPPTRGVIRQGRDIHPPRKIGHVDPIYPALAAARQWQFTPTMLAGEPWPIAIATTVTFEPPPSGGAATSSGRTPRP